MFHVKHCRDLRNEAPSNMSSTPLWKTLHRSWPVGTTDPNKSPKLSTTSFSDAEVPENNVENVVNVDAASEAAQGARGEPQFFG